MARAVNIMTDQLGTVIGQLVKASRADGALVWHRSGRSGEAIALAGHPMAIPLGGLTCDLPSGADGDADPTSFAPEPLIHSLPAAPAAVRTLTVADDLLLTVAWCDPAVSTDLAGHSDIIDQVAALARLSMDLHLADCEVARLHAAVDGLQDGVVTVSPALGLAVLNRAAATLLDLRQGENPLPAFDDALARLARAASNSADVEVSLGTLKADPMASVESMWRFPASSTAPTHLWVVTEPVTNQGFAGRTWVFYNESESAQALESLAAANAQLRASADGMLEPQALLEAVRDADGQICDFTYRDVNRATCTYLGMAREELIGRTLLETMPNLRPAGLLARYAECVESGEPLIMDDVRYDNEILASPRHYDLRGNFVGGDFMTLTWRDVTERAEATQRIALSEERFRLIAENSSDVVGHIRDGIITWVSPSVNDVLGAPPEHWVGKDMRDAVPPDEHANQAEIIGRILSGENVLARSRVLSVDGTTHWIHLHGNIFRDSHGEPDGLTVAFRVIDDEVRIEQEVEAQRRQRAEADARYRRLMDNSAVGMSMVTPQGRFEIVNPALCDFFGYDAETLRTKTWQELTAADSLDEDLSKVDDMLAGRIDRYRITKQYLHADGHLIWGDLSVSCLRDANGEVEYFVSQIIDITSEVAIRRHVAQRDQQNRALAQRLQAQTDRLRAELRIARDYVTSLLPGDVDGPVQVSRRYLPSRELGGDCFDYRWIDADHLLVYLIDVSGHGIAPALEAISVHNLLRSGSLEAGTLLQPDLVLAELNSKFPMDQHGGNYFTMWYGVYHAASRTLSYASAGHPPALAFPAAGSEAVRLGDHGFPVGMFAESTFGCQTYAVPPGGEIILYSDGAFELPLEQGAQWSLPDFIALCTELTGSGSWSVEELARRLQAQTVAGLFDDDCSLLRLRFP